MNIILLEEHELGRSFPRRDKRTIHLLKVLHKQCGDTFDAGILGGDIGTGRIEKINFDGSVLITFEKSGPPPAKLRLRMAVAFVRPIQMRRILRELSNMGVSAIDIIGTDLGEKSYRDTKLLKDGGSMQALIEGVIQARDTQIPSLAVFDSLDKWLEEGPWEKKLSEINSQLVSRIPILLAMDNIRAEGSFFHLSQSSRPIIIAIGPERGWSDRERDLFEKAGFIRLSMGNRALRTETACVSAAILAIEKTEQ